jgi:DNA ligase-associated metallophosphoesterase
LPVRTRPSEAAPAGAAQASDGARRLELGGAALLAEPSGALYWPAMHTLVVADLHFEKGSSFAARGVMLPPYDTTATIAALEEAVGRRDVRRVLCLGDSFHDERAAERLPAMAALRLRRLVAGREWVWIAGNHDPAPPAALGGRRVSDTYRLGPLAFRHIAAPEAAPGEVSGHYHPKATIAARGRRLTGRCFVHDRRRLVLPAFGAYAGGLDVGDSALRGLFEGDVTVHLIARGRVTSLPRFARGTSDR